MKLNNWGKLVDFSTSRLGYTINGKQEEIIKSQASVKVVLAARRTGKSFAAALMTYSLLCYSSSTGLPVNIIFAGPRAIDVRHIHNHLHNMLDRCPVQGMKITYDNYSSPSVNKKKMIFENGSKISTASLDDVNMEDIRGDSYDLLICDEYGAVDYKIEFMQAASQSLKDKDSLNQLLIIGSPDLGMGDVFDELMEMGEKDNEKIQSWHLNEADCPFIDRESAEVMNSLLDEYGRLREVDGLQVPPGGRLFPEFLFNTQVLPQIYNPTLPYFIGVDFGRNKPVVEFTQPDGQAFRVFHEISCKDILVENLVKEIKLAVEVVCKGNQPTIVGCDKAGKAKSDLVSWTAFSVLKAAFPQATFTTSYQLVSKDNQTHLYRKLTMQNRIFIDPSCKKLITAFIKATPNTTGQKVNPGWKKKEGIDDPLDALIYGLINHDPGLIIEKKEETHDPNWAFKMRAALDG